MVTLLFRILLGCVFVLCAGMVALTYPAPTWLFFAGLGVAAGACASLSLD